MAFVVHAPGAYSLLVDAGRLHSRSLGMPIGGAADRTAMALGNALVGNAPSAVALEIALAGPTLEATQEHGCVLFGADFQLWINDRPQPANKAFTLRAGDILTIATPSKRLRGYLCVCGGFEGKEILGSRSALEPLQNEQRLECPPSRIRSRFPGIAADPAGDPQVLRILPATHTAQFTGDPFTGKEYQVDPNSNRMGLRMTGEPVVRPPGEPVSSAVCPGTVQATNDGQLIILGVDAQTIGGYPRLAHIISADLDKLGQLAPGDSVRFEHIDLPAATALCRQRQVWLTEWVTRLRYSFM